MVAWLAERLPEVRVCTKLPAAERLREELPVVRVRRAPGGQSTHAGETTVLFELDALDTDPEVVWATTRAATEELVALSTRFYQNVLVDDVRLHSGPGQATHPDPELYRTFQIVRLASRSDG
ncbi:hypothetical protein HNR23_002236 [Nocardiopsis mwathae]|uniref:DUF3168 domain-containing protein n=1 Tax=Nocardiopsis mwathae TaxID=1472723 RepID=A0A7X0D5Z2_9ACTN|nr:hypothetical protein [Nocardiopsis mwathae]MBB6172176.1 hypothetical protein [Nocardiopsis mwathae]